MRIFPILTAIAVSLGLYLMILQRDKVTAFARGVSADAPIEAEITPSIIPTKARAPISVLVLKSTAKTVDNGIVLRGRTSAARNIDVRAEISGLVISEPLRKGSTVTKGQVLCELDAGTRQAALDEAKARLAEARINENTASSLAAKGFGSATVVTARRAALEAAQAGVQRAMKEIERLQIKAPFAGLLESDSAEIGALMQPGALCANIIQLDPIKLVGFAPEQDIAKIKFGARAGGRLISGKTVQGQVSFLSRSADPNTRTFRVEVEVANKDLSIPDGSTAEIFIAFDGQPAHLLPQSALTLDDSGQLGVRLVIEDLAQFRAVTIIRDTAEGLWVAGLPDVADVIVVGQEYATDGRRVLTTYKVADK